MFSGFPGEGVEDLERTAIFIEKHAQYIDRIRFNRFSIVSGTPIQLSLKDGGSGLSGITVTKAVDRLARVEYRRTEQRAYREARQRALRAVFEINRRSVRPAARQFDGLM
jgi:anaerobic magnesium-protoporphyrin IX monomethyl ester cyclase